MRSNSFSGFFVKANKSSITPLPKTKSLKQKMNKFSALILVVCSALTTPFLTLESSSANIVFNKSSDYVAQTKQNSTYRGNYLQFKYKLGQRETGQQNPPYNIENSLGFIGKYQFGEALLIDLGYYQANVYYGNGASRNNWQGRWTGKNGVNSKQDFLNNQNNAQERAIDEAFRLNWNRLNLELQKSGRSVQQYLGASVRGITITSSGLLATAHLRGPRATAEMLLFDRDNPDENGTSIFTYLSEFAGFQTPFD